MSAICHDFFACDVLDECQKYAHQVAKTSTTSKYNKCATVSARKIAIGTLGLSNKGLLVK